MKTNAIALLYNIKDAKRARKIKFIFVQMGVHIKNMKLEEYLQPIGAVAGMSHIASTDECYSGEGFEDEMLLMRGFSEGQINDMMLRFRKGNLPKIDLKAVITSTNQTWDSITLYQELKKEHKEMNG